MGSQLSQADNSASMGLFEKVLEPLFLSGHFDDILFKNIFTFFIRGGVTAYGQPAVPNR